MDTISIDGVDEHAFRRSIETLLRHGQADSAAARLRGLVAPLAGERGPLPGRFCDVSASNIDFPGWDDLPAVLDRLDRQDRAITALCLTVTEAQDPASGNGVPLVETRYFTDDAFPFSEADREDLLEGYSIFGCEWQGNFDHADTALRISGIDDLFAFLAELEAELMAMDTPDEALIHAGSLGSCYLSVLVHQALCRAIREKGLPRPLCVMAGSDGVYPFFDAPVMSADEYLKDAAVAPVDLVPAPASDTFAEHEPEPAPEADAGGSLLSLVSKGTRKSPVLTIDRAEAEEEWRLDQVAAARQLEQAPRRTGPDPLAALRDPGPAWDDDGGDDGDGRYASDSGEGPFDRQSGVPPLIFPADARLGGSAPPDETGHEGKPDPDPRPPVDWAERPDPVPMASPTPNDEPLFPFPVLPEMRDELARPLAEPAGLAARSIAQPEQIWPQADALNEGGNSDQLHRDLPDAPLPAPVNAQSRNRFRARLADAPLTDAPSKTGWLARLVEWLRRL